REDRREIRCMAGNIGSKPQKSTILGEMATPAASGRHDRDTEHANIRVHRAAARKAPASDRDHPACQAAWAVALGGGPRWAIAAGARGLGMVTFFRFPILAGSCVDAAGKGLLALAAATLLSGCIFPESFPRGYVIPPGALEQIPLGATQEQV